MSGSWTKGRDQFFACKTWSVNCDWYWEIAIWSCADILYFRLRGEKMFFSENFINMATISWEKSKPSWRYQNFFSREEDVHVPSSPIYGNSVKWRKTINEMGGNIPGGNFPGANFPRSIYNKVKIILIPIRTSAKVLIDLL